MKKTIMAGASTGIVAGMILMGTAGSALADTSDHSIPSYAYAKETRATGMHMMHRWNSNTKAGTLAGHLGLDPNLIKQELKSGKTLKQVLQENGIVPGQLQKAFESSGKKRHNKSLPQ